MARPTDPRTTGNDGGANPRLQKYLADEGLGSRRELEGWIAAGRVTVNGRRAEVGDRVGPRDVIYVDGRRLSASRIRARPPRVIRYHKPVGEVCSRRDPAIASTVFLTTVTDVIGFFAFLGLAAAFLL